MGLAYLVILLALPYKLFEVFLYVIDSIVFGPIRGIISLWEKAESFFD